MFGFLAGQSAFSQQAVAARFCDAKLRSSRPAKTHSGDAQLHSGDLRFEARSQEQVFNVGICETGHAVGRITAPVGGLPLLSACCSGR